VAANPIYIETEEEIPEVIERIRRTSAEDVPLVLPTRSRFGQSRFNFQLLKEYTAQMGKRISIVSPEPAVQQMAEESGFRTFRAVEQLGTEAQTDGYGEAVPARPAPVLPPPRRAVSGRSGVTGATAPRIAIAAPKKLVSKAATEVRPGRFLLYAGAGLLLVIGLVVMCLYVPSASVTLTVNAVAFKQDNLRVDVAPGTAPVKVRAQTVAQQATSGFKATGVKTIPAVLASGSVVFRYGCAYGQLTLPRGTRVRAVTGAQFYTKDDVGPLTPNQVGNAPIAATSPGASGNVGPNTVTALDYQGVPSCISVTNPDATSGGADEQKKTVLQTSDVETARSSLDAQLRKQIGDDLAKQTQNGEKLSDQVVFQPADFATDHHVGDEVTDFSATMKLSGEGAFYSTADVDKAFADLLAKKVPADKQLTDNPIKTDYAISNASSGGHLTFMGSASAFLAPKIDFEQVKARLVGRTLSTAKSDLGRLPVKSVDIKESPFKLPLMPLQSSRITVRYVVQQVPATTPPSTG
jgi:Baseplate J-like protein